RFSRDWSSDVCSSDLVVGQQGGGGLPVTAGDSDQQRPGVPGGELDLGDHRNPLGDKGLYQGNRIGYARTLHHQSRIEDLLLTVEIGRASCRESGEIDE